MRPASKVVIVTGGGSSIGAAMACLLAKEGAQLTIAGRRQEILIHGDEETVNHGKREKGDGQGVCARGIAFDTACPGGYLGRLVWTLQSHRAHRRRTRW